MSTENDLSDISRIQQKILMVRDWGMGVVDEEAIALVVSWPAYVGSVQSFHNAHQLNLISARLYHDGHVQETTKQKTFAPLRSSDCKKNNKATGCGCF
jgi:hypothetical protein